MTITLELQQFVLLVALPGLLAFAGAWGGQREKMRQIIKWLRDHESRIRKLEGVE